MELTNVKYLERGLRMSGDKANADLVRDMDAELATLRAELAKANVEIERLRDALKVIENITYDIGAERIAKEALK